MITKVLITGSRDWHPADLLRADLQELVKKYGKQKLLVIHGGAPGVDTTAGEIANDLGIHVAVVNAMWSVYYKGAGPVRNGMMLALAPDVCYAYFNDKANSKGTKNMVAQCQQADVPVFVREKEE